MHIEHVVNTTRGDCINCLQTPRLQTWQTVHEQRSRSVHEHEMVVNQSQTSQAFYEPFTNIMNRSRIVYKQVDYPSNHRLGHPL